ncbi:MAG: Gfo/Idh/MocA family protein [Clostridium sp.]
MSGKINFGIIGTGKISQWFLEGATLDKRFVFKGLYSRTKETGEKFLERYSNVKLYTELEEMIMDDNIHAIYIASPNSKHSEQAIMALKAGKSVLCEKAFAGNLSEANEMVKVAKENNTLLMEAMRIIALPNFISIKNNIHKIGKIRKYIANNCQYSSRYDNFKNGIIENAFKPELANGALMDIGVYGIHPMVALFGKPKEVWACGLLLYTGVDGQGTVNCEYDDFQGVINFSKITNSYMPSEIQGEDGTIVINKITTCEEVKIIYRDGSEELLSKEQVPLDIYYEVKEFIDLIEKNKIESMKTTLESSLIVMDIMDKARNDMGVIYK